MFGSKRRRNAMHLMEEFHRKHARVLEAVDRGDCSSALDAYTLLVLRYASVRAIVDDVRPSQVSTELATSWRDTNKALHESQQAMRKCLCAK